MTSRILFVALLVTLAFCAANGQSVFKCIMKNCADESWACDLKNCYRGLYCMATCGGKVSCILTCQASYWDKALANMVDCALNKHKCIVTPNPNPVKCTKPATLAQNFELSLLTGKFHVVYGMNKDYDCFDNDVKDITQKGNTTTLSLTNSYDIVRLNGKPRSFVDKLELSVTAENNPAILDLKTLDAAFPRADEYRILSATKSYVIVYYCGSSLSITYEGAQVFSRKPVLSSDDDAAVSREIAKRGWKLSTFCKPKVL